MEAHVLAPFRYAPGSIFDGRAAQNVSAHKLLLHMRQLPHEGVVRTRGLRMPPRLFNLCPLLFSFSSKVYVTCQAHGRVDSCRILNG
eukprot:2983215-Pyramimonas_sp.AAC.1